MKLALTLLVRNEEDTVAANIEFHASQGVELFVVTDNGSTDATPDLLRQWARRVELTCLQESRDDFDQPRWVTRMARLAAKLGADWVINSDADEFWFPGRGSLRECFSAIPVGFNVVRAERSNFIYVVSEGDDLPFFTRMVFRDVAPRNFLGRPLPAKVAHIASPDVRVGWGNHSAEGLGAQVLAEHSIAVLHFPIRSHEQLLRKVRDGGAAVLRNPDKSAVPTWRAMYREYLDKGGIEVIARKETYDWPRLARALAAGDIVVDERLARYMQRLSECRP